MSLILMIISSLEDVHKTIAFTCAAVSISRNNSLHGFVQLTECNKDMSWTDMEF